MPIATTQDRVVTVQPPGRPAERHTFDSAESATRRSAFINEAMLWIGTPFVDCMDVRGPRGGVDCAMLLTRASVDAGLLPPFDPRPYSPRHMQHSSEERFLGWIRDRLGAVEVDEPRVGDVLVWQFGRCFCHGAVLWNGTEVVHAYAADGMCTTTGVDAPLLTHIGVNGLGRFPRPRKAFSLWGG